jgi:hypothetical protein
MSIGVFLLLDALSSPERVISSRRLSCAFVCSSALQPRHAQTRISLQHVASAPNLLLPLQHVTSGINSLFSTSRLELIRSSARRIQNLYLVSTPSHPNCQIRFHRVAPKLLSPLHHVAPTLSFPLRRVVSNFTSSTQYCAYTCLVFTPPLLRRRHSYTKLFVSSPSHSRPKFRLRFNRTYPKLSFPLHHIAPEFFASSFVPSHPNSCISLHRVVSRPLST